MTERDKTMAEEIGADLVLRIAQLWRDALNGKMLDFFKPTELVTEALKAAEARGRENHHCEDAIESASETMYRKGLLRGAEIAENHTLLTTAKQVLTKEIANAIRKEANGKG